MSFASYVLMPFNWSTENEKLIIITINNMTAPFCHIKFVVNQLSADRPLPERQILIIWDKIFKNGTNRICGRQPLENLK